ncbi:S-adenosyl-L-methionine-dependent methyltransferase [Ramicandelaber brevisporus]|nr:S-adenosyl-L-methionine-dependent methyltransferase [Ramicandelaber brevisporus]
MIRLETPSLSHFKSSDYDHFYEPAEDTFLLIDALEQDASFISARKPLVCIEVGSGSGCVSAAVSDLLRQLSIPSAVFSTDINIRACSATRRTCLANVSHPNPNCITANVINCQFADVLADRLSHSFDLIIFNPPYVPTPSEEVGSLGIEAAWAGGVDGREVIDEFLPRLDSYLSANGMVYMVLLEQNRPREIAEMMSEKYNMQCDVVISRKAGGEKLHIMRIVRR